MEEGTGSSRPSRRNVGLDGAPNFRDLGGYPGADGRVVRCGLVYRSESLAGLSDRDLEVLRRLGIGLVVDLRSAGEKRAQPNRWPQGLPAETLGLDVDADLRAGNDDLLGILKASPNREGASRLLLATYRSLPLGFGRHLARLFDRLSGSDCPPAVMHCTVGKDRTGFLAAMLLFALGVPRSSVYEDYVATADFADPARLAPSIAEVLRRRLGSEPDAAVTETLLGVHRDYLDAALAAVESDYGAIDRYLETVGGLNAGKRERLRARLLE